ncbi:MAG: M48 family metallopeptidase [Burkholderiales bacterium]|nr:M48 family metallopeptidase [Burkholderiales bacterium]
MNAFSWLFALFLALSTGLALWLARRHAAHVRAHRDRVPEGFASVITPDAHRRAADYTVERTRFGMLETLVDAAVLLALTFGGGLQMLAELTRALPQGLWRELGLVAAVVVLLGIVGLPFSWHRVFGVEQRYGFNRMTPALFVTDLIKGVALAAVLGAPFVMAILWFIESTGTFWWLYAWLAYCAFQLLLLFLAPTFIMPLFNKFTPLEESDLKRGIEALLSRCGFASGGLFVMDGSKRSRHSNAFFSGFGSAKRIVLFDTLIQKLGPEEIEAVLAHELGHFRHRHIVKRIVVALAVALFFFAILGTLLREPWFHQGLGVSDAGPAMGLVLLTLVMPSFTFVLTPLMSIASRRHEYEADAYAASHTSAGALVGALTKIYNDNAATLTPDPLHSAFYDSHPPAGLRIGRLRGHAA